MNDLFEKSDEEVYTTFLIRLNECPKEVFDTFICFLSLRESIQKNKDINEDIFLAPYGAKFYGSTSHFYGVCSQEEMLSFWKVVEELENGKKIWKPNLSHPSGRKIQETFERICFFLDFTDEIALFLKKYGFKIRKSDYNITFKYVENNNEGCIEISIPHAKVELEKISWLEIKNKSL